MSLVEEIDRLINDIGGGLTESNIRNRLTALREQAEAFEAALQRAEADVKRLETNAQTQNLAPAQDRLDETSIRFLKLIFDQSPLTISQIASALGVSKGIAEYHRDVLEQAEMIGLPMVRRLGRETPYHLLPKGREYLVQNKLA